MARYSKALLVGMAAALLLLSGAASGKRTHRNHLQPCIADHPPVTQLDLSGVHATLLFSPRGGGEQLIVQAIDHAKQRILMQAYSFTDSHIFAALGRARQRGVDVKVILDNSDTQPYHRWPSVASRLAALHIPVWIDYSVETAHNKVLILDSSGVITGSYNFTYAANYRNAENLLYFHDAPKLARAYIRNWNWRRNCSHRYVP